MSELDDPLGAVLGLAIGGVVLIMLSTSLSPATFGGNTYFDLGLWGAIFLLFAVLLAVGIVVAGIASVLRGV